MENRIIISEHVVNDNVAHLESKDFLNRLFSTCIICMDMFTELSDFKSGDPADYDEFMFPDTEILRQFVDSRFAIIPIVNNVLNSSLEAMDQLDALLNEILDLDSVPEDKQESITKYAGDGVSFMSTFIFYEFLNTPGYDEIVYSYCGKYSVNIDEFIKKYATIYKQNRRSLGVFNDHPELEQPFLEVVGPALPLIPEDALTLEDVAGVISGELPLEALMERLGVSDDDEGSASSVF